MINYKKWRAAFPKSRPSWFEIWTTQKWLMGVYALALPLLIFTGCVNDLKSKVSGKLHLLSPDMIIAILPVTASEENQEEVAQLLRQSLYANLDTISFWDLDEEIELLKLRGYSTREMQVILHRSFAFPFFLLSMLLLSSVFTLGIRINDSNWTYVFLAIISSVLIFFFNDFSAALGETDKLPIELSVWMPITIIFIFSLVGLIHANQR